MRHTQCGRRWTAILTGLLACAMPAGAGELAVVSVSPVPRFLTAPVVGPIVVRSDRPVNQERRSPAAANPGPSALNPRLS